jgi:hypothetical protein
MEARRRDAYTKTWTLLAGAALCASAASSAAAQLPVRVLPSAGSELERYLRDLSLTTKNPAPSTRPGELAPIPDSARHPWAAHFPAPASRWAVISPQVRLAANTSFPYGFNDGPAWQGKGLTAIASGGFAFDQRWLAVRVAPTAFVAQNASFRLRDNGIAGQATFADGSNPTTIDQPQRFGGSAYARLDPGESEIRLRAGALALGASSAAEVWGPATEHPLILGPNAGGIPRVFIGTSRPVSFAGVILDARMIWGRLDESGFGTDTGASRRHFATGATATIGFRGVPGLELGGIRFIHTGWPDAGWRQLPWTRVFQEIIGGSRAPGIDTTLKDNPDNQLGSVFVRWTATNFEAYLEFGRDDRNGEIDDLIQEPDHDAGFTVGLARVWKSDDGQRMTVVRGELMNTQVSNLQQGRAQTPWYLHGGNTAHGHTQRGQVLGSAGAYGGGASALVVDRYTPSGRTTVRWDRLIVATQRDGSGLPQSAQADVSHALGLERSRFVGRGEVTLSATLVKEFNRQFAGDAWNANLGVSYRLIH